MKGKDFIHWLFSPLGQSLLKGQTSLHKSGSGQLTVSHLISNSQFSSNREALDGRQEGRAVPVGDLRGWVVASVVIPGSTAVRAAQAFLYLLSPATGRSAALGDG